MSIEELAKLLRDEFKDAMMQYLRWRLTAFVPWEKMDVERKNVYRKVAAKILELSKQSHG